MELAGLPDFHAPVVDAAPDGFGVAFWPYGGGARCFVLPDTVTLGLRADGSADFKLELIRPIAPGLPPPPSGVIEMAVAASSSAAERALAALRLQNPNASIEPLAPSGGSFRFVAASSEAPAALLEPIALAAGGLGALRLVHELPLDAALILRDALEQGSSIVTALAELDYVGVTPRLPLRVRFDPLALLRALGAASGRRVVVARDDIVSRFRVDPDQLGLAIVGPTDILSSESAAAELADAMTDLVRLRYGAAARVTGAIARPLFALVAIEETASAHVEWDLAQPMAATRTVILRLDAFAVLGAAARRQGIASLVTETTVPRMPLGTVQIDVAANLPARRVGLRLVGCDVAAAPLPPWRPDALVKTATFTPPDDKARLSLQLSPGETPRLSMRPFVWRDAPSGPIRLDGVERPFAGTMLTLGVSDFPVIFVPIETSDDLVAVATVNATCRWNGSTKPLTAVLSRGAAMVAFALPPDAANPVVEIEAVPLDQTGVSIRLAPAPARPVRLCLASFPQFGPHSVTIAAMLAPDASIVVLDVRPEGLADEAANVTTLAFTRSCPSREWSWFAASPFVAGYRWRRHVDTGAPKPWSEVQSPFAALTIPAPQATEATA